MWSGFDSRTRRHKWIEFVVGLRPCSKGFSPGSPVFLPPQKSALLNSNYIWKQWMKSHFVEMPLQISFIFHIYLFIMFVSNIHAWDLHLQRCQLFVGIVAGNSLKKEGSLDKSLDRSLKLCYQIPLEKFN